MVQGQVLTELWYLFIWVSINQQLTLANVRVYVHGIWGISWPFMLHI